MGADDLEDDFEHIIAPHHHKRRKLDEESEAEAVALGGPQDVSETSRTDKPTTNSKRRRKEQAKARKRANQGDIIDTAGPSIALAEVSIQADYLSERQSRSLERSSALEKEGLALKEAFIVDATTVTPRATLSGFLEAALPDILKKLGKVAKKNGSPRVLVVAAAALRVADLCRDLRKVTGGGEVAKLFAKHFKLAEHIEHCQAAAFNAAVGTPDRIGKLLEAEALALASTEFLILDATHRNDKGRNLFEQPETRDSLFLSVLAHASVMTRLQSGKMKILLY